MTSAVTTTTTTMTKYPLFELSQLLSFDSPNQRQKVLIRLSAYAENGDRSILALWLSNEHLILRYCYAENKPRLRQLPWFLFNRLSALCFDPSATWILATNAKSALHIIPALAVLDEEATVEPLWHTNDLTIIPVAIKRSDSMTCVVWWQTLDGHHIAIVGTRLGCIMFVNLKTKKLLLEAEVRGSVQQISLINDDCQSMVYALIAAKDGNYWRMLLESENVDRDLAYDNELTALGYQPLKSGQKSYSIILDRHEEKYMASRLNTSTLSVTYSPQYARGRHLVTTYDLIESVLEVYDPSLAHNPLFVYRLPPTADHIQLSDSIIMCTTILDGVKFVCLSSRMAESARSDDQPFNPDAVLQSLDLKASIIQAIYKRSAHQYRHAWRSNHLMRASPESLTSQSGEGANHDPLPDRLASKSTVLDGCLIVTEQRVYECRQRLSPERLFMTLCLRRQELGLSDQLGIMLGLDVNKLYNIMAEYELQEGKYSHAMRLFQMSKCSLTTRLAALVRHDRVPEALHHLQQVMSQVTQAERPADEKKLLADLTVLFHLYLIVRKEPDPALEKSFRDFMLVNQSYDERRTIELLMECRQIKVVFDLAKVRGLMADVLQYFIGSGALAIPDYQLEMLLSLKLLPALSKVGQGVFLRCFSSADLLKLVTSCPELALDTIPQIRWHSVSYSENDLVSLIRCLDPSKPCVRSRLQNAGQCSRRKVNRSTSLSSANPFSYSTSTTVLNERAKDGAANKIPNFLLLFAEMVVLLNVRRNTINARDSNPSFRLGASPPPPLDADDSAGLVASAAEDQVKAEWKSVACGMDHTALIRHGQLYTFGNPDLGKLGHGAIQGVQNSCPPCRIESFYLLSIGVLSVACGKHHTLALTQQGVYGWGSSTYGQVGVGTRAHYGRPIHLDALSRQHVTSLACGQFHSAAVTAENAVYTWGWGVHGQLGHGDVVDCLVPTSVRHLALVCVVAVAAGYAHTVVRTKKGDVYVFGCNMFGQIGLGTTPKATLPVQLSSLDAVSRVDAGYFTTYAITLDYQVFTWGINPNHIRTNARHGADKGIDPNQHLYPRLISIGPEGSKVVQIGVGSGHAVALADDGMLYSCGVNQDGQLGSGDFRANAVFTAVSSLAHVPVVTVACGATYSAVIGRTGDVYVFGKNTHGQLGMVPTLDYDSYPPTDEHVQITPSKLQWTMDLAPGGQRRQHINEETGVLESCYSAVTEQIAILPDLSLTSSLPYCVSVLRILVRHLSDYCDLQQIGTLCYKYELWDIMAEVYNVQGLYSQAVLMQLRHLSTIREPLPDGEFSGLVHRTCTDFLEFVNEGSDVLPSNACISNFLRELMVYWNKQGLQFDSLQGLFEQFIALLALPLTQVLFNESSFLAHYSVQFCIRITNCVIDDVTSCKADVLSVLDKGGAPPPRPVTSSRREKLWKEILQNLKQKDANCYLTMSSADLAQVSRHSVDDNTCVAFTCGHYYSRQTLNNNVLPRLTQASSNPFAPTFIQTKTLLNEVYQSTNPIGAACPVCALNYIDSIT